MTIYSTLSSLSWSECSSLVDYSRADLLTPVIPLYQKFFQENKIRILVYSGDVDGVVPHTGTEGWLANKALQLTVDKPFQAWKGECRYIKRLRFISATPQPLMGR